MIAPEIAKESRTEVESPAAAKVLITSNPLDHEGGVVNYYRLFLTRFESDGITLCHASFGSRMEHFYSPLRKALLYPFRYFCDYCAFILRLIRDPQIRIVQVSPSLIPIPLFRDAFVLFGAKLLRRQTVVFFRGWKPHILDLLRQHIWVRWLFGFFYGQCDCAIVLAARFRDELAEFFTPPAGIEVTTTMFEQESLVPPMVRRGQIPRFLFLGRVSELKGIGELIEAVHILREQGQEFELEIVGHGDRPGVTRRYETLARERGVEDYLSLRGRLVGKEKFRAYANADVYVFPSWTEGCPTSVLEALGSGLFVLSTDVGALSEIIEEGRNGQFVAVRDPKDLAEKMRWTCDHIESIRDLRESISTESSKRYSAQAVVRQFEGIYNRLLENHATRET